MTFRSAFCRLLAGCSLIAFSFAAQPQTQAPAAPNMSQPAAATSNVPSIPELRTRAEAGNAGAQYQLGRAYEYGQGVPQDDDKAAQWYRKSADQGFAKAQTALGVMYRVGHGVEQDKAEAVRWYEKAAKQGDSAALFNLAVAYYNGDGVVPNEWTAYKYFLIARKAGSKAAEDGVIRIGASLRADEIANAMFEIGEMYDHGQIVAQDYSEAAGWYDDGAARGNSKAQVNLARLYDNGTGVPQDFSKALALCEAAAKRRSGRGQVCAGFHYQRGWGVKKDPAAAAQWYQEAMKLENGMAFYLLGHMYWSGEGVPVDKRRGYEYLLLVAAAGDADARRDIDTFKNDIDPKDAKYAEKKAQEWVKLHGSGGLFTLKKSMN